ncbi:unnamed protein product [Bursaphelenchus xylophilus]|uniref:(pine wood nematode) hypothetical protein n=1 Tax=Bursaphelenchus xylophilus TaxID=6326 RepID=A0A7I8XE62_BURXY|nr:unnamed protein product [Bursaphelenchus xylophilus]CAG9113122.1 unnamed protein product [Bursaphelenchus xylophilus]
MDELSACEECYKDVKEQRTEWKKPSSSKCLGRNDSSSEIGRKCLGSRPGPATTLLAGICQIQMTTATIPMKNGIWRKKRTVEPSIEPKYLRTMAIYS